MLHYNQMSRLNRCNKANYLLSGRSWLCGLSTSVPLIECHHVGVNFAPFALLCYNFLVTEENQTQAKF